MSSPEGNELIYRFDFDRSNLVGKIQKAAEDMRVRPDKSTDEECPF
jgi:hypothetical protein